MQSCQCRSKACSGNKALRQSTTPRHMHAAQSSGLHGDVELLVARALLVFSVATACLRKPLADAAPLLPAQHAEWYRQHLCCSTHVLNIAGAVRHSTADPALPLVYNASGLEIRMLVDVCTMDALS